MALTPGTRLGPYKIAAQIAVSPNRNAELILNLTRSCA